MEVLQESVQARGSPAPRFTALLVNFKKLRADPPPAGQRSLGTRGTCEGEEFSGENLLHAVAGLCSVALPDMEESAIYSSLTRSGSKTIVLLAETDKQTAEEKFRSPRSEAPTTATESASSRAGGEADVISAHSSTESSAPPCGSGKGSSELENPFLEVFSASDSSDSESAGGEDEFSEGRRRFLEACRSRHHDEGPLRSGPEERVAGCGCFLRLSHRPQGSALQVLLLAVRRRWRRAGLGSFLLQAMKDPAVVGDYDSLLTFADHKAEQFFTTHGFSDDPILTAKYRVMVDHWENSSLMAYIPPFSVKSTDSGTGASGRMAALSLCEDSYKSWRELAIASYCEQLSLMQRLRHEVVLLHGKLETREAEMKVLKQQLEQARREKSVTALEFSDYRKRTQKLLCEAAINQTQKWLESVKDSN